MTFQFFCPRWGSEHIAWKKFLLKVKAAGYDGIEYGIGNNVSKDELNQVWKLLKEINLKIIPQHYETHDSNFSDHAANYEKWLKMMIGYPCEKINVQTGKDYFSFEQNAELISIAKSYSQQSGTKIIHETHRGKFSFAAHITKEYLKRITELEITLDVSHWINVAESYLADQPEALELAIARTDHIHARVGYPEGPQIPDPRVAVWQEALTNHLSIWDRVIDYRHSVDPDSTVTITPEFGAPPYMILLPRTGRPISNQWDVNKFMMETLRARYHHRTV